MEFEQVEKLANNLALRRGSHNLIILLALTWPKAPFTFAAIRSVFQ
jgi:hypothetical protein